MAEQNPCILTLDPAVGIITNTQDMVAYVIRQFFGTPGRISDTYGKDIISFREIKSTYNTDTESIKTQTQVLLTAVMKRLFPTQNVAVECGLELYSDIRYTLTINVYIESPYKVKKPVLTTANVYVENDEFKIKLFGDVLDESV